MLEWRMRGLDDAALAKACGMTPRRFARVKARLVLVDDPAERDRLLLSMIHRHGVRLRQDVDVAERRVAAAWRRSARFQFLLDSVRELVPEIANPEEVLLGELIDRVRLVHPELATQLAAAAGIEG